MELQQRHLDFVVHSRKAVESAALPDVPHIVVSITTSPFDEVRIPSSPHCLGILRLAFFDSDLPAEQEGPDGLFSRDDARQIWRFVLPLRERLRCIVLHCNAGVSRSPGVAAALSKVLCGDDQAFFERYRPNQRVYRLLLDVFTSEFSLPAV
jgi:predicted protein tyrosine phosphatase